MQGDPYLSWAKKMVWCSDRVFATSLLDSLCFSETVPILYLHVATHLYMRREMCQLPVVILIAGQQYGQG